MKRYTPWLLLTAFVAALVIGIAFSGTPTHAGDRAARPADAPSFAMAFRPEHDDDEEDWGEAYEEFEMMVAEVEMYSSLLDLIEQYAAIAADKDKAAIAAVLSVDEHLEPDAARKFLGEMLSANTSQSVKRAIHMKMFDLYDEEDTETVKAHLRALITE